MSDQTAPEVMVIDGLSTAQRQELLYELDVDTVSPKKAGLPSTSLGDFATAVLILAFSAAILERILRWVERQDDDIVFVIEIGDIKLKIGKSTPRSEVAEKLAAGGIALPAADE